MTVKIKTLAPGLLDDYLGFFDHTAFIDNPDWADCYCNFYLVSHRTGHWESRTGEQNRCAVRDLIAGGGMHGYLAYVDGAVAGWCHAGPKGYLPALAEAEELAGPDVARTGSIVCFVVAPAHRGEGVATALLDAACRGLADMGLTVAEAYPRPDASGDAANYHGPLRLYERAGFAQHRREADYVVVRMSLRPPTGTDSGGDGRP